MRTVIYKTLDGHKIITGFDRPTVDGVETGKIVSEAIKETPEWQAVEAKKAEYSAAIKELSNLKGRYKKGSKISREAQDQWNYASAKAKMCQDELKPLAIALSDKLSDLRRSEAVYFEPRAGEVVRDDSEVDVLVGAIQGRSDGTLITLDGATVTDNRGRVYFRKVGGKWGRTQIVRIGDAVPADAVTEPDETQRIEIEIDRVSALSADAKAKEKNKATSEAMKSAAAMRNELEIKADPEALTKSQEAYQVDVNRIEGLYG